MNNPFVVHKVDVAGKYMGQKRINWSATILSYIVILTILGLILYSGLNADKQDPLTEQEFQDRWESDPRW